MQSDMQQNARQERTIPMSIYVNEVSKLFFDRMHQELEVIGVKKGYHHILMHLSRKDGKSQLELTKDTHFRASTISVALQKMEQEGLVERKADAKDARQVNVFLTEKGRALDELVREQFGKMEQVLLQGFSKAEEETLKTLLIKMRNNIHETDT